MMTIKPALAALRQRGSNEAGEQLHMVGDFLQGSAVRQHIRQKMFVECKPIISSQIHQDLRGLLRLVEWHLIAPSCQIPVGEIMRKRLFLPQFFKAAKGLAGGFQRVAGDGQPRLGGGLIQLAVGIGEGCR